jgi:hypothetical protein
VLGIETITTRHHDMAARSSSGIGEHLQSRWLMKGFRESIFLATVASHRHRKVLSWWLAKAFSSQTN